MQLVVPQKRHVHFVHRLKTEEYLRSLLFPKLNHYIPKVPTPRQGIFLNLDCMEAFYGGAAAGGKTEAILMAALQYVHVPDYSALILRRTYPQLNMPNSILDRAHNWLRGTDAHWNNEAHRYEFPSGAKLVFGYLQHEKDKYNYDGPEFQYIAFDELTQFLESQYTFLFGRLRRLKGFPVPLRMRAASNPGGIGHQWVKDRFITNPPPKRAFIPAKLEDNPHADIESYREALSNLDPITRKQREDGDWDIVPDGAVFKREWFREWADFVPPLVERVRFWDCAATKGGGDWTVGALIAKDIKTGRYFVEDVRRDQLDPEGVENMVWSTASADGRNVRVRMEQEPGSSGKTVISSYRKVLKGYNFKGIPASGPKAGRWNPFARACEKGQVTVCNAPWNAHWLSELLLVPEADHDDQADATSGSYNTFVMEPKIPIGISFVG